MKRVFLAIVTVILSIGLVLYFFTLESFQLMETVKMKMAGATSVQTPNYHYFEKNNCTEGKQCQCVLLIHGLGDMAFTWRNTLGADKASFAKDLHMFAVNLPGALSTPKLSKESDYNVQNMARLVAEEFMPKCESWVVVGNSFGGWMATFMALNLDKVKGLLLLSPAGLKKDYSHVTNYFLDPTIEGARGFYNKLYYKPKDLPDFVFKRVVERLKTQTVLEQLRSVGNADYLDPYFSKLKVPVRYVWGDADYVIPADWGESYSKATPGSHLTILKNCGHVPQKECFDQVQPELNALLNEISPN